MPFTSLGSNYVKIRLLVIKHQYKIKLETRPPSKQKLLSLTFFLRVLGERVQDECIEGCDIMINNLTKLKNIMEQDKALKNTTETGKVDVFH